MHRAASLSQRAPIRTVDCTAACRRRVRLAQNGCLWYDDGMCWTPVRYHRAVHLTTIDLWLDPRERREWAVVSHAHRDHIAAHEEAILTEATRRFMALRHVLPRAVHVLPYGEPRVLRGVEFTLWPSGHLLGGAQVTVAVNGQRVLYSGDFKLKPNAAADAIVVPRAETLIMETTFGTPRYAFPPAAEVIAAMRAWCAACLQDGVLPVLLGYAVGKGQEILAALAGTGWRLLLHDAVYAASRLAEELGVAFPPFSRWTPGTGADAVLICPPHLRKWLPGKLSVPYRTAIVSGWALDPSTRYRFGADAAFCLSDHADYADLLAYVEQVHPQRVFTVHGFASEFANALRRRGYDATALDAPDQLALF